MLLNLKQPITVVQLKRERGSDRGKSKKNLGLCFTNRKNYCRN
jgi:hypothetical protein